MGTAQKAERREQDKSLAEIVAEQEAAIAAARKTELTPARIAEMEREREIAGQARVAASKPMELKPGTKVKVHITGWMYDPRPAEVVSDNMGIPRLITAKRLRGGDHEEKITVNFHAVSLWRG